MDQAKQRVYKVRVRVLTEEMRQFLSVLLDVTMLLCLPAKGTSYNYLENSRCCLSHFLVDHLPP